jgi:hypothetical protein
LVTIQRLPRNFQVCPGLRFTSEKPVSAWAPEFADTRRENSSTPVWDSKPIINWSVASRESAPRPKKIRVRKQWNIPKAAKNGPKFVRKALVFVVKALGRADFRAGGGGHTSVFDPEPNACGINAYFWNIKFWTGSSGASAINAATVLDAHCVA